MDPRPAMAAGAAAAAAARAEVSVQVVQDPLLRANLEAVTKENFDLKAQLDELRHRLHDSQTQSFRIVTAPCIMRTLRTLFGWKPGRGSISSRMWRHSWRMRYKPRGKTWNM